MPETKSSPTEKQLPLQDSLRRNLPVSLTHQTVSLTFRIPTQFHSYMKSQILEFGSSLDVTDILSEPELAAAFLAHLANLQTEEALYHPKALQLLVSDFEKRFLQVNDIHGLGASLGTDLASKYVFIRNCYAAYHEAGMMSHQNDESPVLLQEVDFGRAQIYAIFGGQGNAKSLLEDIGGVRATYGVFVSEFCSRCSGLLLQLSLDPKAREIFEDTPLDLESWLRAPHTAPENVFITQAPVSFPLIGTLQLLNFMVTCKCLNVSPSQFSRHLQGIVGHSQGVVIAAFVSAADSWDSFQHLAKNALTALFWIGLRSQQVFPPTLTSPEAALEFVDDAAGSPTPMLSVRGLPAGILENQIHLANKHLSCSDQVQIALINDARNNLVVAGPPSSLCALNRQLRRLKAPKGRDESRTPFSKRKLEFSNIFLPISAPFHTKYLIPATPLILDDLKDIELRSEELKVRVSHSSTGIDLRSDPGNLVPRLITMVTEQIVNWPIVTSLQDATHFVDFGPSGIGALTSQMKAGTGVRVILADTLNGLDQSLLYKSALFSRKEAVPPLDGNWAANYKPQLICRGDRVILDTPLTRLLGVPPLIVGGMTPTTAHADFAAAIMQAGYHVELAAGGFHTPTAMEDAIHALAEKAPKGRGITINLVYAAPRAIAWQVPLISRMLSEGVPIEGLTIGAGVPSLLAAELYLNLDLRHISFKPGSVRAIDSVLDIAAAHPNATIILQWTGGRGGGHHSSEDFHAPLLKRYAKIRRQKNVLLVAGSGFGTAEEIYPYVTGTWATKYGYPQMPLDGLLLGSRMMVAKEAHTSPAAKQAIIEARGVPDSHWEMTLNGLVNPSGVISIVSEMGEPMHVIATRGALLWAELDNKIFSKSMKEQLHFLGEHRLYVINRLNTDFQKVWFAQTAAGNIASLSDLSYSEVVSRLFRLLSFEQDSSVAWIDKSYRHFIVDFLHRINERSARCKDLQFDSVNATEPEGLQKLTKLLFDANPTIEHQLLLPEDTLFFLQLCQRRGYKPVPFVPALDENFQTYFKKDSLWQSEKLESVTGKDVGRVIILHGPVAAQYSKKEESAGEILSGIHNGLVDTLMGDGFESVHAITSLDYLDTPTSLSNKGGIPKLENALITRSMEETVLQLPNSAGLLPSADSFHQALGGSGCGWRRAAFSCKKVMCGERFIQNPIKRIFAPAPGQIVTIEYPNTAAQTRIVLKESLHIGEKPQTVSEIWFNDDAKEVVVQLQHRQKFLVLKYAYHPETISAPFWEITDGRTQRIKSFFWQLWYGDESQSVVSPEDGIYRGQPVAISNDQIRQFALATGNRSNVILPNTLDNPLSAPLDFAFIVVWKSAMKPLFALDLDLLRLVHLSNQFNTSGAGLQAGDSVTSSGKVTAIVSQESGVMVEVTAKVRRHGSEILNIISRFLYRNTQLSSDQTFQRIVEDPMKLVLTNQSKIAVLTSRPWFRGFPTLSSLDLVGKTLVFHMQTSLKFSSDRSIDCITTRGDVYSEDQIIGSVESNSSGSVNPVMSYLHRHGEPFENISLLKSPIALKTPQGQNYCIRLPPTNVRYAQISGDFNPIHTSRAFAAYVDLPGIITHGMHTSAAIRGLLERIEAGGDSQRIIKYNTSFQGTVVPGDELSVSVEHVAMRAGRKIFELEARNAATDDLVLSATAEIEQATTAFIFTGQGSQQKNMGMQLRETSSAAAAVWKLADDFFRENYGFAISSIVQTDPKMLTIHFGGTSGRRIRENYLTILGEAAQGEHANTVRASHIFQTLKEPHCRSYTFSSHLGLLSATQFTQPALIFMEVARFADIQARGLVPHHAAFAGHSLGEYGALFSLGGGFMNIEKLASITFVRGLTMQLVVERDEVSGRSEFSMCAINPSKVNEKGLFDELALELLVAAISAESGWLLEVVNYNIANIQYVCAGHVRALACITNVINQIIADPNGGEVLLDTEKLKGLVSSNVSRVRVMLEPIEYKRGPASIPLNQIDVPFHSSFLATGIDTYRRFLRRQIQCKDIVIEALVGKWIPNITGKRFGISKSDFEDMFGVTGSDRLRQILDQWE